MDRLTGSRQKAGVAFYEEEYGEYRLKIDFLSLAEDRPPNVFLRAIGAKNGHTDFVVEAVVRINRENVKRTAIGSGFSATVRGDEVHMKLGPFENILVMTFPRKMALVAKAS